MSSRELLGNSAPTVNDSKVRPSKLAKRADLTLSVLTQEKKYPNYKKKIKGCKETFGSDGYVYHCDGGDGIIGACMCPKSSDYTH